MTKLTKEFLGKQKTKLLQEKTRLENELKILERFPQYGDQEDDNTEEVDDFFTSSGEDAKMLMIYKNIKIALKKMDKGTYDICDNCKKQIPQKRLEAILWANTCLKCEK